MMRTKRLLLSSLLLLSLSGGVLAQEGGRELQHPFMLRGSFERLRTLDTVAGATEGFTTKPSKFFLLTKEFMKYGTVDYFKELLKNERPVVRVMGLACLAQTLSKEEFGEAAEALKDDAEEVRYIDGRVIHTTTVGKLAGWLKNNPYLLGRASARTPAGF
jgi:hypothetical protein